MNLFVAVAPSTAMLVGTLAVVFVRLPPLLQASTQNFSAGLLISAVASELYPLLKSAAVPGAPPPSTVGAVTGLTLGFVVGLVTMFGLEMLVDEDESEPEDAEKEIAFRTSMLSGASEQTGLLERQDSDYGTVEDPLSPRTSSRRNATKKEFGNAKTPENEETALSSMLTFHRECKTMSQKLNQIDLASMQRHKIDEVMHMLMYHIDVAKDQLTQKEPLSACDRTRLEARLTEVKAQFAKLQSKQDLAEARKAIQDFETVVYTMHSANEKSRTRRFSRWKTLSIPSNHGQLSEKIPWTTVFAVTVDAVVDGTLIGLSYSASHKAGLSMALATCIEMGFLGFSFSATIQNTTRSLLKHMTITLIPPVMLFLAGICGYLLGSSLESNPNVFIGFIAFCIVALLFLVTQELLTEAREVAGSSALVNSMTFVGLLAGILMDKLIG